MTVNVYFSTTALKSIWSTMCFMTLKVNAAGLTGQCVLDDNRGNGVLCIGLVSLKQLFWNLEQLQLDRISEALHPQCQ